MRFHEFKESRTDEIAPVALGALKVAGGVAKAGANVAAKGAQAAGRLGAKMGGAVAGKAKNAVVQQAQKLQAKAGKQAADKLLKKGLEVPVGQNKVRIDKVQGNEVTLADPKNKMAPKTVLQKNSPEIQNLVKSLTNT